MVAPDSRQGARQMKQFLELRFVAYAAPIRVITVLLAAFGIATDGLQMTGGVRADPDIGVGGRDRE